MAKIYSPNEQYNGVSASVQFTNGVGETDDENLITWFSENGYRIEDSSPKTQVQSPKPEARNLKSKARSPKSKI